MKHIILLLSVLLMITMMGCSKVQIKPNVSCPDVVCQKGYYGTDREILQSLSDISQCKKDTKAQVECYKKSLK